ncbi:hypothetical protein [Draconibacterium orientale]|uniref:hypothetical protein n=1 Tax=Draconibacterium orientale TaxID=1168034 RepID=UPI002ABDF303|nr:hypothetical protein [Draconibacterium orientale]
MEKPTGNVKNGSEMRLNHREMEKTTAEPKKPLRNAKNQSGKLPNGCGMEKTTAKRKKR